MEFIHSELIWINNVDKTDQGTSWNPNLVKLGLTAGSTIAPWQGMKSAFLDSNGLSYKGCSSVWVKGSSTLLHATNGSLGLSLSNDQRTAVTGPRCSRQENVPDKGLSQTTCRCHTVPRGETSQTLRLLFPMLHWKWLRERTTLRLSVLIALCKPSILGDVRWQKQENWKEH